jgi:hypothetical protein
VFVNVCDASRSSGDELRLRGGDPRSPPGDQHLLKNKTNESETESGVSGLQEVGQKERRVRLNNDKFSVSGHTILVPKLGAVNMAEVLRFDGKIING